MVEYPIQFDSQAVAEKEDDSWTLETEEGLKTKMTIPKEFGGDDRYPSPEDLFSASIQSCMIATFKTIAERKNLNYESIKAESSVTLDRGEDSRPVMKEGEIEVKIKGVENTGKAKRVAEAAEKNCFIHNSVKTEIDTEFNFL